MCGYAHEVLSGYPKYQRSYWGIMKKNLIILAGDINSLSNLLVIIIIPIIIIPIVIITVKLSISSPSNHMLDIYQNRRSEEILIPIRNI